MVIGMRQNSHDMAIAQSGPLIRLPTYRVSIRKNATGASMTVIFDVEVALSSFGLWRPARIIAATTTKFNASPILC